MTSDYDAIIVGASFAGLAVARRLRGRILLLDRHEVGAVQTSVCGTPLWVPQSVGVEESVLQVHEKVVVHAPTGTVVFDVSDVPYCTFDYRKFCRGLQAQSDARFLRTAVRGLGNGAVETEAGRFVAPCIIDCSGWRGVLVRRPETDGPVSFGLETEAAYPGEALYFWAAPGRERDVISWIFPVGGASRIGVGSYAGESKLKAPLTDFMEDLGLRPPSFHGTYFPSGLREPTVDTVFAVGDAAGQCLPLTAEGIRPALYFGDHCGRLVQAVIDGRLTLRAALAGYRRRVLRYRHAYRALRWAQRAVLRAPRTRLGPMAELANRPTIRSRWWPRYAGLGKLDATDSGASPSVRRSRS